MTRAPKPKAFAELVTAPDEAGYVSAPTPRPGNVRAKAKTPPPTLLDAPAPAWLRFAKWAVGFSIVSSMAALAAFSTFRYAKTSPRFSIREISVKGALRLGPEQVRKLTQLPAGTNIFDVNPKTLESALLKNAWLSEAKVARELPSTLTIEVKERAAVALALVSSRPYLLTRNGEAFKELEPGDPYDLPIITGAASENLARDRRREVERLKVGLEVLAEYERTSLNKVHPIEEIHMNEEGDVSLSVGKLGMTFMLGKAGFRKKLLKAEEVVANLGRKDQKPKIVFLDNEAHPERVVVRMR